MSFTNDLSFGKQYETKFLDYLDYNEYDEIEVCPNTRFTDWDIRIKKGNVYTSYEIKADKRSASTGNLCIEYECSGLPSGISTTQADYYGYFVVGTKEECYLIPTGVLRSACSEPNVRECRCGDGYRARAYLLPLRNFQHYRIEKKR